MRLHTSVILLVLVVACTPEPPATTANDDSYPPHRYSLDDVTFKLSAGSRSDAGYVIVIRGAGTGTYEGGGVGRTFDVPRNEVEDLLQSFYDIGFFKMRNRYEGRVELEFEDGGEVRPMVSVMEGNVETYVTVEIGDYRKEVLDDWGTPGALRTVEERILELAGVP